MKLKYRLVITFLIMVLVPVLLLTILVYVRSARFERLFNRDEFSNNEEVSEYSDQEYQRLLSLLDGEEMNAVNRRDLIDSVVSIGMILVLTAVILMFWIYRSIISDVNKLIYGANNIKEGNLDFTIATEGTDEFSELINTFEDMKERLRQDSEEKLIAEKEQRELISNIAHDLKTPLTAIRGYAEGLLDGVADTEEKREAYIRTIRKKAEDLNTLLNELTTYSNISTNRIPYNFNHINVNNYFRDMAEEFEMDFKTSKGKWEFSIDVTDGIEMIADPEQLRRVIENLVDNSVKYKRDEALKVSFRVKEVDNYIQVELEDNGKGIKNEDIPYIFDRMYRADASRSAVGGSGLGLSIAKKIIEDHGGRIWATSRVGVGTCFYLIIRQYTLTEDGDINEQDTDNRRRRGNSRARERLS